MCALSCIENLFCFLFLCFLPCFLLNHYIYPFLIPFFLHPHFLPLPPNQFSLSLTTMFYFILLVSVVAFFVFRSLFKSPVPARRKLPLPPGSMGWPYMGETLQLYSQDPNVFFASKKKRFLFILFYIILLLLIFLGSGF